MAVRDQQRTTIEDYRALPETGPRYELIGGKLYRLTSPTYWHQVFVANLLAALVVFVKAHRLGRVSAPVDVFLSYHDVVQPDIVFVSKNRAARTGSDGVHGAPDLVVEALSPSTRKRDLGVKKALYAEHGVIEYWVADLRSRKISLFRLQEDADTPAKVFTRAEALTSELLRGFSVPLRDLFDWPE